MSVCPFVGSRTIADHCTVDGNTKLLSTVRVLLRGQESLGKEREAPKQVYFHKEYYAANATILG